MHSKLFRQKELGLQRFTCTENMCGLRQTKFHSSDFASGYIRSVSRHEMVYIWACRESTTFSPDKQNKKSFSLNYVEHLSLKNWDNPHYYQLNHLNHDSDHPRGHRGGTKKSEDKWRESASSSYAHMRLLSSLIVTCWGKRKEASFQYSHSVTST